MSNFAYDILYVIFRTFFSLFFRLHISGIENIPKISGLVLASNHVSLLDPIMIGCTLPRRIHFMAKGELFSIPLLGWALRKLNTFPVRRGIGDKTAIITALNLLKQNQAVLLFPEGTRSKTGEVGQGKPGVAMLAAKTCVPIVPVAVIGPEKIGKSGFFLPQCKVCFAKPIIPEDKNTDKAYLELSTNQIMEEISRMKKEG